MDRAYLDYARLYRITHAAAFFVTRTKKNTQLRRIYSRDADLSAGIIADQTIKLMGVTSCNDYPEKLRRIVFRRATTNKRFVFLTNNFSLPPKTIADLYKSRWQIEIFFKWIK